jgi:hypothetical protein
LKRRKAQSQARLKAQRHAAKATKGGKYKILKKAQRLSKAEYKIPHRQTRKDAQARYKRQKAQRQASTSNGPKVGYKRHKGMLEKNQSKARKGATED